MTARIYQPARSAMQSGEAKDNWLLEYEPEKPREIEPLMGWTSSSDMRSQVKLKFDTKEEAIAYAERNGIAYRRRGAKAGGAQDPVLFRQFRPEPDRSLVALKHDMRPGRLIAFGSVAQLDRAAAF